MSRSIFLTMGNILDKSLDTITKHTFYVQSFFSENSAVHEIMWKKFVEPNSPKMTIEFHCTLDN